MFNMFYIGTEDLMDWHKVQKSRSARERMRRCCNGKNRK